MVLINIDRLSDSELKYIAEQEKIEDYASLSRDEIIDALEEIYEDDDNFSSAKPENTKFIKALTNAESDVSDLPGVTPLLKTYNTTEVHLILRDNNWAYAFWSVSEQKKIKLSEEGSYSFILKACLKEDSNMSYDIEIDQEDSSWSFELPWPGKHYYLQLIAKYEDREEVVAESETITSPKSYFVSHANELRNPDTWDVVVTPLISNGGETVTSIAEEILKSAKEGK